MKFKKLFWFLFLLISIHAMAGTVDTIAIQSVFLKKTSKVVVIQPSHAAKKGASYPVVYLLHGYSDNYAQWIHTAPQLAQTADALKIIFVCPDGGYGSWYFDSPIDSSIRYESYITKELVPYVDAHYATKAQPNYRAITGLSMGGHGALYLAIKHSEIFGAAGSTSGAVDFTPFPDNWDLKKSLGNFDEYKESWINHTVLHLVDNLQNNQLALIIDCGMDDFFMPVNNALHEKLLKLKINHDFIVRPGEHNHDYWRSSIDYQILFFSKYFNNMH
jgi:S-formylglutathione hydrolase FrmB